MQPLKWLQTVGLRCQVHSSSLLLLLLALFQIAPVSHFCFFIDKSHSPATHEWSYNNQLNWRLDNKQCGHNVQSPIDIQRRYVIPNTQLKLHFYNYNQPTKFKIQNAHHTIKLNPIDQRDQFGLKLQPDENNSNSSITDMMTADEVNEPEYSVNQQVSAHHTREPSRLMAAQQQQHHHTTPRLSPSGQIGHPLDSNNIAIDESSHQHQGNGASAYGGAPTIKLDWLDDENNEYKLRDIHFHWGERRDNGSEHAIDGRRAAMEMHLVHIKHGLDKANIGFTSDSVTVISVLIESYRKSNADFNPIVNALTRINMTDQTQEIEYKSINDLLPNMLASFYTYSGSLTTPPCYQVVNWIVMSERLYLNAKQIEMFRNMYAPASSSESPSEEPNIMTPNIRHIQPLNNRTIMASFLPLSKLEQMQVSQMPPTGGALSLRDLNSGFVWCWNAIIMGLCVADTLTRSSVR